MTLRFGTDGVRGVANAELTPELVLALGRAGARILGGTSWVVGRDTRVSGPLLQAALTAGLASEGVSVVDLGVLPTPGVAAVAAARVVPAAMLSASHNPFADNGVKLFAAGGRKLSDETESRLEAELSALVGGGAVGDAARTGGGVGQLSTDALAADEYAGALVASLEGRRLDGLRVVLDCANGAASSIAPDVFRAMGAQVSVLNARPDGLNINEGCGSTHPGGLQATVVAEGAELGLAFDGDADRVLAVDHAGQLIDGDQLMAVCALDMRARGRLAHDTVVVTVMTNLGFRLAMAEHRISVVDTPVGDRHVLAALEQGGFSLGGEQSGHVVFAEMATTGDGILTGLQVADAVRRAGRPLADLAAAAMTRLPQVMRSVRVARRAPDVADAVRAEVEAVEAALGARGRVLVRPSGTEPVVRVMVEADDYDGAVQAVDRLVDAVERACGAA